MNSFNGTDWQSMARHATGFNTRTISASERSASADEVENILGNSLQVNRQHTHPDNNLSTALGQYTGRLIGTQPGESYVIEPWNSM